MRANVRSTERVLRVLIGAGLVVLAFFGILGPWAYIGIIPLLTGFVGYCPLYRLIGRGPGPSA